MTKVADTGKQQEPSRKKKGRSPSYPGISLGTAIERASKVYDVERTHPAPLDALLKHWDYAPKSGPGLITIAALKKFGLLQDEGSGASRKAKLTDLALRIIQDKRESSDERAAAVRQAALSPPIHAELWEKFGGQLPSDDNLRFELVRERSFTETGATEFIQEFKSTIDFAKLGESDSVTDKDGDKGASSNQPKRHNPKERNQMPGTREDVFNLEEGQAVLQWPEKLSPESFEEFKGWIELVLRRAKRAVISNEADTGDKQA
jgi:hypothetical protein